MKKSKSKQLYNQYKGCVVQNRWTKEIGLVVGHDDDEVIIGLLTGTDFGWSGTAYDDKIYCTRSNYPLGFEYLSGTEIVSLSKSTNHE